MTDGHTNTSVWVLGSVALLAVVAILLIRGGGETRGPDATDEVSPLDVEREMREGGLMINRFPSARRVDEGARALGMEAQALAGTDISALQIHTYTSAEARERSAARAEDWCPECIALVECGQFLVAFARQVGPAVPGGGPDGVRAEAERGERILDDRWGPCTRAEFGGG